MKRMNEVSCTSAANYPYYPTQLLLDLEMLVIHNDESFCKRFLSKYGDIIDWYNLSFSDSDVHLVVILDCGQSIAVSIDANEFKEWLKEINNK